MPHSFAPQGRKRGPTAALLLARAQQALQAGRFAEAEGLCRGLLARAPSLPEALHLLAACRARAGAPEEALGLLDRALAAKPRAAELYRARAFLLQRLGRRAEAISALEKLLSHAPEDLETALALAALLAEENRGREAGDLLRRALVRHPGHPLLANALGTLLLRQGWAEEALSWLDKAAAPGGFAEAEHNRATALADLGRIAESAAAAERARAAEPRLTAASWHLALCRYDAGDRQGARELLEEALKRAPLPLAQAYLAALLQEAGEATAAETLWRQARAAGPHLVALGEAVAYRRAVAARTGALPPAFGFKASALRLAAAAAPGEGLVLEFGVFTGRSLRILAHALPARRLYGFDSFEGLPEHWIEGEGRGSYSTGGRLPSLPANVELVAGWFAETLPPFLAAHEGALALAHLDCDLYRSTAGVLECLAGRLRPGSILIFDEYFAYDGWRAHEFKAFQELIAAGDLSYDYLALSPFTRQAVIRIGGRSREGATDA